MRRPRRALPDRGGAHQPRGHQGIRRCRGAPAAGAPGRPGGRPGRPARPRPARRRRRRGASLAFREADLRGPLALVVGSEGRGISGHIRRRVDLVVRIPMRGQVASLNASVAGSVLLFEAAAQRPAASVRQPPTATDAGGRGRTSRSCPTTPEPTARWRSPPSPHSTACGRSGRLGSRRDCPSEGGTAATSALPKDACRCRTECRHQRPPTRLDGAGLPGPQTTSPRAGDRRLRCRHARPRQAARAVR